MITVFLKILKMLEKKDEEFLQFLKAKKVLEEEEINNVAFMAKLIKIEQEMRAKFSNELFLELQSKAEKDNEKDILKLFDQYSQKIMQDSKDISIDELKRG